MGVTSLLQSHYTPVRMIWCIFRCYAILFRLCLLLGLYRKKKCSLSFESLLDILRCPACVEKKGVDPGQLDFVGAKWFICRDCDRKYPVRNRIPIMLTQEGDKYRNMPLQELVELGE